jgi:septum formation protein
LRGLIIPIAMNIYACFKKCALNIYASSPLVPSRRGLRNDRRQEHLGFSLPNQFAHKLQHKMDSWKVILASSSPRRQELLQLITPTFQVIPSSFEENYNKQEYTTAVEYVLHTAQSKAEDVWSKLDHQEKVLMIAADTIVVLQSCQEGYLTQNGDLVLEKAENADDARRILTMLSGKVHYVHTAVCLYTCQGSDIKKHHFVESTSVQFADLSRGLIDRYVSSGEYVGKAGAYGIQTPLGPLLVSSINGCYTNVVGLPIARLRRELPSVFQH